MARRATDRTSCTAAVVVTGQVREQWPGNGRCSGDHEEEEEIGDAVATPFPARLLHPLRSLQFQRRREPHPAHQSQYNLYVQNAAAARGASGPTLQPRPHGRPQGFPRGDDPASSPPVTDWPAASPFTRAPFLPHPPRRHVGPRFRAADGSRLFRPLTGGSYVIRGHVSLRLRPGGR